MGQIKAKKLHSKKQIVARPPSDAQTLTFSFKYLELNSTKFHFDGCEITHFVKAFERLQNVSARTKGEMIQDRSDALRSHEIKWNETTEPNGFAHLNEQLKSCTPWQFSISSNKYGRVHGFWIDSVFFIVWFDFLHKLYP